MKIKAMRTALIIILCIGFFIFLIKIPDIFFHWPSVWEISTQKVAHDGDTTGPLFECMREWDSIAEKNKYNIYEDGFMDKYLSFYKSYLNRLDNNKLKTLVGEAHREEDDMWAFSMDYIATCRPLFLQRSRDIYPLPIKWWHKSLAPFKSTQP